MFLLLIPSCNDFISLYVVLEGSTLTLLALLLVRNKLKLSLEAILKYFCLSTIATMFLLIGVAIVFFYSNSFNFLEIAFSLESLSSDDYFFNSGLVFLLLGMCFKLAIFPGHIWAPDVYESLNFDLIIIFASAIKISVLVVFLKFFLIFYNTNFNKFLMFICIGSVIVGLFGALVQKTVKGFLAFSSVNQLGFVLLGLTTKTYAGFLFTLFNFTIYNLALLSLLFIFNYLKNNKNKEIVFITDLQSLYKTNPILSFLLLVLICSFAGLPPLIGFVAKFTIFFNLLIADYYFLTIVLLGLSVISSYYYLRIIKVIFFELFTDNPFLNSFFFYNQFSLIKLSR